MHVLINERSFVGQATSHNAQTLMQQLAETLDTLDPCLCGDRRMVHSTLASQPLIDTQTLYDWLFNQRSPRLQALKVFLMVGLRKGPFIDTIMASVSHLCDYNDEDVSSSSLAGAAHFHGALVSLDQSPAFASDPLIVQFCYGPGANLDSMEIPNFHEARQARRLRRRYVPNPKHHPARARPPATEMPLDPEYDPMDAAKQIRLLDPELDPPDTAAQRLLDRALPSGKQFYARTSSEQGRNEIFYEFQPDNAGGYHGYVVPEVQVPADVVRRLRQQKD
jgi:hypothetical protein